MNSKNSQIVLYSDYPLLQKNNWQPPIFEKYELSNIKYAVFFSLCNFKRPTVSEALMRGMGVTLKELCANFR